MRVMGSYGRGGVMGSYGRGATVVELLLPSLGVVGKVLVGAVGVELRWCRATGTGIELGW